MRLRHGFVLTATATVAGGALLFGTAPAGSAPTTESFEYTGAAQTFVVPTGVCEVVVVANGAEGGDAGGSIVAGLGGRTTATIAVTPGEELAVLVGGAGSQLDGGFNGGGDGDVGFNGGTSYGGGGASDVRQGGVDLADRVAVAGGGGGRSNGGGTGGDAGGLVGLAGGGVGGGGGGTQSAGGAALGTAEAGALGQGGFGGNGGPESNIPGGGGGGGYYGGAGGTALAGEFDGSGGGGGSGFGPAGAVLETGVWGNLPDGGSIDGLVEITFDTADGGCAAEPTPPPAAQPVAAAPRFTG